MFRTNKPLESKALGSRFFFTSPDLEVGIWCTNIRYIVVCRVAGGWTGYVETNNGWKRVSALKKCIQGSVWQHSTMPRGKSRASILERAAGNAVVATELGVWLKEGNNPLGLPQGCRTGKLPDDHADGIVAALAKLVASAHAPPATPSPTEAIASPPTTGIVVTGTNNSVTQNITNITNAVQPVVFINLGDEVYMDQLQTVSQVRVVSALENPLNLMVCAMPEVIWFNGNKPHQHTLSSMDGIVMFRTPDMSVSRQVTPADMMKLLCKQLQTLIEWALSAYPCAFDWKARVGLKQIVDLVMAGLPKTIESSVPVHKFLVRWGEDGLYDPEEVGSYVVEQIAALTSMSSKRGRMRTFAEIIDAEFV
jgi:hypothetical protein